MANCAIQIVCGSIYLTTFTGIMTKHLARDLNRQGFQAVQRHRDQFSGGHTIAGQEGDRLMVALSWPA
jgi:hypothetical protein